MAKDDYFVITYKLLKYLYDCLKKSGEPNMEVIDATYFSIGKPYWDYIVRHLQEDGYIDGVLTFPIQGGKAGVKITREIAITPKGIQYLEENTVFQKIKREVKDIAEILPM